MVEGHSIHGAELAEVIFVGGVVAMPGNNIEGGEGLGRGEELPLILLYYSVAAAAVLKPGHWALEVPRIGQAIAACMQTESTVHGQNGLQRRSSLIGLLSFGPEEWGSLKF